MNPKSYGRQILPGNFIIKTNTRTQEQRKVLAERVLGHFWMMKDLKETNNKPVLSNENLIPANQARLFPNLTGLTVLTPNQPKANVPEFFLRNNRAKDETAQCTLCAISFKDFGYQLLPSWTQPFEAAFEGNKRAEVVRIGITEGSLMGWLSGLLTRNMRSNTPPEQHDRTLLYFGNCEDFRDSLRMHNTLTGYVFLLDGLGRVRFAGSGSASDREQERLISLAMELTPKLKIERQARDQHR